MGKKRLPEPAADAPDTDAPEPGDELAALRAQVAALRADLTETTHDLAAVVTLLGNQVGEPFRSQAAEIIAKRQTGG